MGAARVIADTIAFAGSLVLVRFISPAEFGRAAAALAFAAIAPNVLGQAFTAPMVQFARLDRKQAESAVLLSLAAGMMFVLLAPIVAYVLIEPLIGHRAAFLFLLTTPGVVAVAAGTVPKGLIQRSLEFRRTALVEIAALVGTTVVSIVLAAMVGLNGEAIVLGFAAGPVASLPLLLIWAPWTPPRWHGRRPARDVLGFGSSLGLSSALATLSGNVDYLALSTRVSAATVGYYWRGFVLAVTYPSRITQIMLSLALPLYSRAENADEMRRLRLRVMATHAAVMFPLLATLIVLAPVLVPWLFGSQWEPSVVPTQFLAGTGMVVAVVTGTPAFITALGKPKYLPILTLVATVGLGCTAFFAAPLGLNAVAACVLAWYLVFLLFNHGWLLHRIGGIPLHDLFRDAVPPLVACVPLAATELVLTKVLQHLDAPTLLILLAAIPAGIVVYCGVLATAFRDTWIGLRTLQRRILGRAA